MREVAADMRLMNEGGKDKAVVSPMLGLLYLPAIAFLGSLALFVPGRAGLTSAISGLGYAAGFVGLITTPLAWFLTYRYWRRMAPASQRVFGTLAWLTLGTLGFWILAFANPFFTTG